MNKSTSKAKKNPFSKESPAYQPWEEKNNNELWEEKMSNDWSSLCHYCDSKADYESMLQEMIICKDCVEQYVRQEVLTEIRR